MTGCKAQAPSPLSEGLGGHCVIDEPDAEDEAD
jgi:hypothetical protein